MGSNSSKFVKKMVSPFSAGSNSPRNSETDSTQDAANCSSTIRGPASIVLTRQGSMYFDEDGDLAHEFYMEFLPSKKGAKAKMKRIRSNLTPQGEVQYQFPRLHNDYPLVLYQL